MSFLRKHAALWVFALVLLGWIAWLRGPSLAIPVWNVDETIHSTVAKVLLDGGTLYRDAIDQRTPVTYYATAAIFSMTDSSIIALRYFAMLMIVATAWLLGRTVSRVSGFYSGIAAAAVFAAFSNFLLFPGDTFAVHTEWYVVFFTTLAAWCFFTGKSTVPSARRCAASGACLGLAVMSKQSALLDLAPPVLALLSIGADRLATWRQVVQRVGALSLGALATIIAFILPSLIKGAGPDLLYYTWTYNLEIYGSEYTFAEKVASGLRLVPLLLEKYPFLLICGAVSLLCLGVRCLQMRSDESAVSRRFAEVYLIGWMITSLGEAMAGGRGFDHYFFPCLAPLAWICVWAPLRWFEHERSRANARVMGRMAAGLAVLGVVYSFTIPPLAARRTPPPPLDPALRVSAWMKGQSTSEDRIFVWGFNPDIYHYTDRLPASRFLYCTFQTGLVPWANTEPLIDTSYAIVPGAMETLLSDLKAHPPRFFVDSSAGLHRFFNKYPLRRFPALHDWLHQHYAEVDPARFGGQGFRIYVYAGAEVPVPLAASIDEVSNHTSLSGHDRISGGLNYVNVTFDGNGNHQATGLGLIRDGAVTAAITLLPSETANLRIPVLVEEKTETISLQTLLRVKDGPWASGPTMKASVASTTITPEQRTDFAVPMLGQHVEATGLRAFFGARSEGDANLRTFAMHAPAILSYEIPASANYLSGRFGLPAGAYASDNPAPSDGAEFIIRHVSRTGKPHELFRRYINPRMHQHDQGEHTFRIDISSAPAGDRIELEITPGPSGVASSDWTYWSHLLFETSL